MPATFSDARCLPVCTATQARVPTCAPLDRLPPGSGGVHSTTLSNGWGTVTVTGRLYGPHQIVIDILLACYEQHALDDGSVIVVAEPYGVLRRMGYEKPSASNMRWLVGLMEDLRVAQVRTETDRVTSYTGVIHRHAHSTHIFDGRGRAKYVVQFSSEYCRLLHDDLAVRFSAEEVKRLAAIPALARGVVRLMRSHRVGTTYGLRTAIDRIAPKCGERGARRRLASVRACAGEMAALGIVIEGDRVTHAGRTSQSDETAKNRLGADLPVR